MPPELSSTDKAAYVTAAGAFFDSSSTSRLAIRQGQAFHQDVKAHNTTDNYTQDVERRMQLLRQLERNIREVAPHLGLNMMQVSFFLTVDVEDFERIMDSPKLAHKSDLIAQIEPFLKTCLGNAAYLSKGSDHKRPAEVEAAAGVKRVWSNAGGPTTPTKDQKKAKKEGEVDTDRKERDQALKRDRHMCVFTEVGAPDEAHIVPHTVNKSKTHYDNARTALWGVLLMMRPGLLDAIRPLLFATDSNREPILGSSDKTWNLIALGTQVHRFFDKAYFGLKPITETSPRYDPDDPKVELICVEWRWLPKQLSQSLESHGRNFLRTLPTANIPLARCQVEIQAEGLAEFLHDELRRPLGDVDALRSGFPCLYLPSGRRIESGMRFDVRALKGEADKTRKMLELQWLALRIASPSGAADVIEQLHDDAPDDWSVFTESIRATEARETLERIEATRRAEAEASETDAEDTDASDGDEKAPKPAEGERRATS